MVKSIEISDFDSPEMYPIKSDRHQWEMVDIWCYAHQFGIATCTGTKERKNPEIQLDITLFLWTNHFRFYTWFGHACADYYQPKV